LNWVFPLIMLIFVPAITMSVWAEERRQGTDELLLTIPAGDFEIVLGKYLAAVSIFSVSLLFSMVCNLMVLKILGDPDIGLFLGTYLGYWLVGLAMLAIGMSASFLTANLTMGFVLGALFNVPLVAIVYADRILSPNLARVIRPWSIAEQFMAFGRGVISLSGIAYFAAIVVVMLYLSMILIGRRHWARGWYVPGFHYLVRTLSLATAGIAAIILCHVFDIRGDATNEKLNALSPGTLRLLSELDVERPVLVEAFVSPVVPDAYVQQQLNLLTTLREIGAGGGDKLQLRIYDDIERFSAEADRASERFGITPRRVVSIERGTFSEDHIFMGVAVRCGLERVVIPFIDRGTSVEYELVKAICSVTQQDRKTIGILKTDANVFGMGGMPMMPSGGGWPIVAELEKVYDVEQVDPANPITKEYHALLAVQPSSLGPQEMANFTAAVAAGQATAIFEDPLTRFAMDVPGTSEPRKPPGGMNPMMMMRQQGPPKGNIDQLWQLLGVDFNSNKVVWKNYNPFRKLGKLDAEFVFMDRTGAKEPFSDSSPIASKLQLLLFPFPGSFTKAHSSTLKFDSLIRTGEENTGTVTASEVILKSPFGQSSMNPGRRQYPTDTSYILAAHIQGTVKNDRPLGDLGEPGRPEEQEINVVLVSDIDMIHAAFFRFREEGKDLMTGIDFNFDNVTFVLNILDVLAGDDRFVDIRGRRPKHRTLSCIDELTKEARKKSDNTREELQEEFETIQDKEQKEMREHLDDLRERMSKENLDQLEILRRLELAGKDTNRRMQARIEQLRQKHERQMKKSETAMAEKIRQTQDWYKTWAVVLPPVLPLLLAALVFCIRRLGEREGVSRSRMR
ncbi:MAG: Gldg family protein, partial [Thermoguttaceae bacterium]